MAIIRFAAYLSSAIATLSLAPYVLHAAVAPGPSHESTVEPVTHDAEQLFWRQPEQVERAASAMAPAHAGRVDVFFVGFAGDDSQDIFVREVRVAADVLAARLDPARRAILLLNNQAANSLGSPIASLGTLRLALEVLAARMDPAEDVLFLYLASHGLPNHELHVANGDLPLEQVSPQRLRELLDRSGFRRRIVVVSACYSGDFASELAADSTVVLTAARSDRPSFGCRDSRGMSYFGEALWQYAMPRADTLEQAFELTRLRVEEMERAARLVPSEPQVRIGAGAREWLARIPLKPATAAPDAVALRKAGDRFARDQKNKSPGGGAARASAVSGHAGGVTD